MLLVFAGGSPAGGIVGGDSFTLAAVFALAGLIAGTLFLVWSGYLLATNQSTIEFYGNQWGDRPGNPYDRGAARNIADVFGDTPLLTLLCPSTAEPKNDGIIYPLNAGRGMPLPMLIDERAA